MQISRNFEISSGGKFARFPQADRYVIACKISDGDRARMIDTACLQSTCRDDLHDTRHDAMITLRFFKMHFPVTLYILFTNLILSYSFEEDCYN